MGKRLLFYNLILSLFTVLILGAGIVYAYFQQQEQAALPQFTVNQQGNIEVDNEFDLKLLCIGGYYNDASYITPDEEKSISLSGDREPLTVKERKSIVLTAKITLTSDLIVSADLNIDLGGASNGLDLNGHNLTFNHYYYGCFLVTNGTITNSDTVHSSTIITNTKNAYVIYDCTIDIQAGTIIQLPQTGFDREVLTNEIFACTDKYFGYYYNEPVSGQDYNIYYIYRDLELITNFYNLDINFEWESAESSVISNDGKIGNIEEDSDTEITLTLSGRLIYQEGVSDPSRTYHIKVLAGEAKAIGIAEINAHMEYYKFGSDKYYIYKDTELPKGNKYYGLEYTYETAVSSDLSASGYMLNIGTEKRTITLNAYINKTEQQEPDIVFTVYAIVDNNYEIANGFIDALSPLVIKGTDTVLDLTPPEDLFSQGVSVLYDIVDGDLNSVTNYYVENNKIYVTKLPYFTDIIYLKADYRFIAGSPLEITRLARIYFLDASMGGGDLGGDPDAPYYAYLSSLLMEQMQIDGRTLTTFNMPNSYIDKGVAYDIDCSVLSKNTDNGYISLLYNGYSNPLTDYVIRLNRQGSLTYFEINPLKLKAEELDISVTYIFTTVPEEGEPVTEPYERKDKLKLHGVIQNSSIGIPDIRLYNAVKAEYNIYNDNPDLTTPDDYLTLYEAVMYKYEFILKDISPVIANYQGIDFLKGTERFTIDNAGNGSTSANEHMAYLKKIEGIKELSIINNSLTNTHLTRFAALRKLEKLNLSGNSLTSISGLSTVYAGVTELRLSDNALTDINGIEKFTALKTLYIDGNSITDFRKLLDIETLIGGNAYIYENYMRDGNGNPINVADYGSEGKYSITTFVLMYKKNINVYNTYNDVLEEAILFDPSDSPDLIKGAEVLESIMVCSRTINVLVLPVELYGAQTYEISWVYTSLSVTDTATSGGLITITHNTSSGSKEIFASVTVGSTEVFRRFVIDVVAA
jgi:hypothetical protein